MRTRFVLLVLMVVEVLGMKVVRSAQAEEIIVQDIRDIQQEQSVSSSEEVDNDLLSRFSLSYSGVFYGPSIKIPSSYQPDSSGVPDPNRPVFMKNFLNLGYGLTDEIVATGSVYWQYRPVLGQQVVMMDPSVRISHAALIHTQEGVNWYGDARVHFGATAPSRESDMITGFQSFNYLSWEIAQSRVMVALRSSARYNYFGRRGEGNDGEVYLGPEIIYQWTPRFALSALYEMGASHAHGQSFRQWNNDGTDLEPGFSWDVTPSVNINPYLTVATGGKISLASTSVGMFLSWTMF
ncbi:hypothetical protein WDW37_10935 [Bdellovibrionota bacterium FG-1]